MKAIKVKYKEVYLQVILDVFNNIEYVYIQNTDIYTLLTQNQLEEILELTLNEL